MQDKRSQFFKEASLSLKREITETTQVSSLGKDFDSMARSEIVFLIEDIFGVDLWGVRLQEFQSFLDIVEMAERRVS